MRAGRLRKRVQFQRRDTTGDAYGAPSSGTWAEVVTVWGEIRETRGREAIEGGALAAPMSAVLSVRSSSLTRAITENDRAVIDSVNWNIRTIANPDQRNQRLEMAIERGVAT